MRRFFSYFIVVLMILFAGCGPSRYSLAVEKANTDFHSYLSENHVEATPTPSGLVVVKQKDGEGEPPQMGKRVAVQYVAKRLDGFVFDSTFDKGRPLVFNVGKGEVIKGLDEGVKLMNKGEKAVLYIPYYLAYGGREMKDLPQYSSLVFEIELVDYEK